jgi:hypothetical protein
VLSHPDEARVQARERLAAASMARPPAKRQKLTRSMTVAALCDLYIVEAELSLKLSTLKRHRRQIERHVKPLLGGRTVRSLTPYDVENMHRDITVGKTARERTGPGGVVAGGKSVAGGTVSMLRSVLELAWRQRLIPTHPAAAVDRLRPQRLTKRGPIVGKIYTGFL